MGRPSKLNPETQKRICDAIKIGVTYKDAAAAAGIAYNTFNEWRKAGDEASSGRFHEFNDALMRAEAEARVGLVANIRGAAKKDWRASAWLLERHDPDTYHLQIKTQLSGDKENPLEMKAHVSDAGLLSELAGLLNAAAASAGRALGGGGPLSLDDQGPPEPAPPAG